MIFYWAAWFFWILLTFFIKKTSPYRLRASICILMVIILLPHHITVYSTQVNLAYVFLYLFCLFEVIPQKNKIGFYFFVSSFILTLAYASFLLFELYDPVWVLFKRNWMLAITLVYLSVLLHSNKIWRLYGMLIGIIQGELLFSMVLRKLSIPYQIGNSLFFETTASAVILLFFWSLLETIIVYVDEHFNQQGKGKQKTT